MQNKKEFTASINKKRKRSKSNVSEDQQDINDSDYSQNQQEKIETEKQNQNVNFDRDQKRAKKQRIKHLQKKRQVNTEILEKEIVIDRIESLINADETLQNVQKQICLDLVMAGWNVYDQQKQLEVRKKFIGDKASEQIKDWLTNPSIGKPSISVYLKHQGMFLTICELVQKYEEWAKLKQVVITIELVRLLYYLPDVTNILFGVTDTVVTLFKSNLQFAIEDESTLNIGLVNLAIQKEFMQDVIPYLAKKFEIESNVVQDIDELKLIIGQKQSANAWVYYFALHQKFDKLITPVIIQVFNNPKVLMDSSILVQLNNQFSSIQKRFINLYQLVESTSRNDGANAGLIISCITGYPALGERLIQQAGGVKITSYQLALLCSALAPLPQNDWDKILIGDLKQVLNNYQKQIIGKSTYGFDTDQVTAFYNNILNTDSRTNQHKKRILDVFTAMTKFKGSEYILSLYQVGIATQMYSINEHCVSAQILPGEGKSYIMTGLANQHVKDSDEVIFVVTNEMLFEQINEYIEVYCEDNVTSSLIQDLTYEKAIGKVLLLDEVDHMIDNTAVEFVHIDRTNKQLVMKGLCAAFYAKKVYMLSATLDSFHELYMKNIFKVNKGDLLQYQSMVQIHSQDDQLAQDSQYDKFIYVSNELILQKLQSIVQDFSKKMPLVIFIESADTKFYDTALQIICKELGIQFKMVDDKDQAKTVRAAFKMQPRGVIRVVKKYARGYDLKLSMDSLVILIANGDEIRYNECMQMFGRSCRQQGKMNAVILMLSTDTFEADQKWQEIKTRKDTGIGEASKNLKLLYQALPYIQSEDFDLIQKAYKNNSWKISCGQFEMKNKQTILRLQRSIQRKQVKEVNESSDV